MHLEHLALVKVDLNKKLDPMQKTIQTFNIDTKRFRKTNNENPATWEIGVNYTKSSKLAVFGV